MYQNYFNLHGKPFGANPDPRYLFLTRDAQEALACLTYGIQARKGFIVLSGEVGTGKTTLLNKLLDWLHGYRAATAFVFNSSLTVGEFLDFMMADFGVACDSPMKSQALLRLNRWLLERYRAGEAAVLIVDEAQNLSLQVLEEIRLLTNLETSTEKLLQIVLAGQPELEEKLKLPQLRQLRQRINLRARLHPLTLEEARGYVGERLRIAGADGREIFTPEAIERLHRCANGIPRLMNLLCEHALIGAFADQEKVVTAERIEQTSVDLELDQRPTGTWAVIEDPERTAEEEDVLRTLAVAVQRIRNGPERPGSSERNP
ncbi:MAG TPA: AAA family ATPase [Candidatus Dormibacteraeota bacterium]|nr:AAA family ATPase [Candidatus Dormibacteraeota bacterium]